MGGDRSIAGKIASTVERLRGWLSQAERARGLRAAPTSQQHARIRALEREVRNPHQAKEILDKGIGRFCDGESRPPVEVMIAFFNAHRSVYGAGLICRILRIAPRPVMNISSGARDSR